jgi:hypothetical protein
MPRSRRSWWPASCTARSRAKRPAFSTSTRPTPLGRHQFGAEALDRRTRAKGQHGGVLKGKGLDVLRALLRGFYSPPLAELGIIEVIRRKVVERFISAVHRVRFDVPVQTSNS